MIPKKIHYCWIGGNPLPESAKKCIATWKKYCPDYEIIEWNETNYDFKKIPYMEEAYEAKKWGFVPDYARLDIIYNQGGIYLDVDVEIIKSFDDLLNLEGFAGMESNEHIALGLGFGGKKNNNLIKYIRDSYLNINFINDDGTLNLTPSPALNTQTLKDRGINLDGKKIFLDGFVIFPVDYFCPKSLVDGIVRTTDNTYSIHHFDSSWYTEEQQKEKQERWKKYKKKETLKRRRKAVGNVIAKFLGDELWHKIKIKLGLIK